MHSETPDVPGRATGAAAGDERSPADGEGRSAASTEPTGLASVDAVLRDLEDLHERPLAEHVGAFERAHEQLRQALSEAGRDRPGPRG